MKIDFECCETGNPHGKSPLLDTCRHVLQGQKQIKGQRAKQSPCTEKEKSSDSVCILHGHYIIFIMPSYPKEELVQRKRLRLQCQGFSLHLEQPLQLKQE